MSVTYFCVWLIVGCHFVCQSLADDSLQPDLSCGTKVAFAFLKFNDIEIQEAAFWERCQKFNGGATIGELQSIINNEGLECDVCRVSVAELKNYDRPAILFCRGQENSGIGHFLLFFRGSDNAEYLLEPTFGNVSKMDWNGLETRYSGICILKKQKSFSSVLLVAIILIGGGILLTFGKLSNQVHLIKRVQSRPIEQVETGKTMM